MEQNFKDAMSKRTTRELVKIVKMKREYFQKEAVDAAEKELISRNIDPGEIQKIVQDLTGEAEDNKEIDLLKASPMSRLIHYVVDFIAFVLAGMVMAIIVGLFVPTEDEAILELIGYIVFLTGFFGYFIFTEFKYQKTFGKYLTKTKVVTIDNKKPSLNDILIRTFCRLIPFDNVSYLFTRDGFHDRLSNTTVIKENRN